MLQRGMVRQVILANVFDDDIDPHNAHVIESSHILTRELQMFAYKETTFINAQMHPFSPSVSFYWHGLALPLACISNNIHYIMWIK